jgi:hypothetical protein
MDRLQGLEGLEEEVDLAPTLGEEPLAHHLELHLNPALWNRNRRNRNFLTSGTGIGTVINYGYGTGTRYNIMYLMTFILKNFSFTFYNKFFEIYQLFPCKTAYYVKRSWNPNQNRNRNFSKVGTGTGTVIFQK